LFMLFTDVQNRVAHALQNPAVRTPLDDALPVRPAQWT
jgi:hypothetical protein